MGKGSIVIVEDIKELREGYSKTIASAGYTVNSFESAEKALEFIKNNKPQLVLSDIKLAKISGLELLQELKSNPETKDVFVVLISGSYNTPDDQSHGLEIGADGYMVKPIQNRELAARIDAFMRHKNTIDALTISEERFRTIITKNADGILIIDKKGKIKFANPAANKLFEHMKPLINRPFGYPIVKDDKAEIYIYGNNGFNRVAEMHVVEVLYEGEMVFLASIRDITDRKIAEEALKKSEAFNRGILDSLSANIAVIDRNGRIIAINDAWKKFAEEYDGNVELLSKGDNYFTACERKATSEEIEKINLALEGLKEMLKGNLNEFEIVYPCHSEEEKKYFLMTAKHIKNIEDNLVVSHVNITGQKLAEEELKKHKENLEDLVKARTSDLENKIKEVERFNELFVDREFRIKELRDKVAELKEQIRNLN
jgi:CheY-like chemotaxis protein